MGRAHILNFGPTECSQQQNIESQPTFTSTKSTIETPKQCVKSVQIKATIRATSSVSISDFEKVNAGRPLLSSPRKSVL